MNKLFLICPVRGVEDQSKAKQLVDVLEEAGHSVHWPPRDTDQNDSSGLRICRDNMAAMKEADVVYVMWDGKSQGCLFDLGMAFALNKRIAPISMPERTEGKSFQNMVAEWFKTSA